MILNNYLIQKEKPINIIYNIKDKILHDTFCKLAVRLNKYHKSSVDHLFTFYQSIYFSTRYKMPIASLGGAEGGYLHPEGQGVSGKDRFELFAGCGGKGKYAIKSIQRPKGSAFQEKFGLVCSFFAKKARAWTYVFIEESRVSI
jgi:hypothetical protein